MIDMTSLRSILKAIYGVSDKYLIPLNNSWVVPTLDELDTTGTWIGYKILSKKRYARASVDNDNKFVELKVVFRLVFVGANAEELADQTMLWEERSDVIREFEEYAAQINYDTRSIFTYPVRNKGLNDKLCFVVDISCQTNYNEAMNKGSWFSNGGLNGNL